MSDLDPFWDASQVAPEGKDLKSISELIQRASDLDSQILAAETFLSELQASKLELLTRDLPEAMTQAGTSKFTTANGGMTVEVKDHVSGSLASLEKSPDKRASQIAYVVNHDGAGIVTADVVARFGKANRDSALKVAQGLQGRDDCAVSVKEDINHMTLKAWARERLEKGLPLDGEQCGLWIGKIAVIKETKTK